MICLSAPAAAWEFTPGLPCLLTQETPNVAVELTHDPRKPLYSITLTRAVPWPEGDVFSITFDGPARLTISTNRHVLSNGGRSLTVTDSGFSNVLVGIAHNFVGTARLGGAAEVFSLADAAEPTRAFAQCSVDPAV